MPFLVTRNGVQRAIRDDAVPGYQAAGWTVGTYVAPEATSVDASGGLWIDPAAAQAQQQFTNDVSLATLGNQQRQTSISGYNAQTGAYDAQTGRFNALVPLLGQSKNFGLLANVVAGDPNAAGLAVANSVGRLAGPIPGDTHTAGLETWQAKDMGDFARSVLGSNKKTSTSAEQAASAPQTRQAGQQAAVMPGGRPGQAYAPEAGRYMDQRPGGQPGQIYAPEAGRWVDNGVGASVGGDAPLAYAAQMGRGVTPPGGGAGKTYSPQMGRWVDTSTAQPAAAGPFAFQPTAGDATRAMGDQRSWTPVASTVPMLAAGRVDRQGRPLVDTSAYGRSDISGSGSSDIRWKNKSHNLIESMGYGHGSDARNAAHKAAGMTGEQFDRIVKHGGDPFKVRKQAAGGTTAVKPPLFTAPSSSGAPGDMSLLSDASGADMGLPTDTAAMLDPHDPHQSPEHLMEIRAILQAPSDPNPSPIEQEVRACWRLDGAGHPVYQHVSGSMDAMTRDAAGMPNQPDVAGQPDLPTYPGDQPDPSMPAAGMPMAMEGGGSAVVGAPLSYGIGVGYEPPPALGQPVPRGPSPSDEPGVTPYYGPPPQVGPDRPAPPYGGSPVPTAIQARDDWRTNPGVTPQPRDDWRTTPGAIPAVAAPARSPAPVRFTPRAGAGTPGGGGVPQPPLAHVLDPGHLRQAARWWAAQHGGLVEDALGALMLDENRGYLEAALGMARAGEIEAILGPERQVPAASPSAPADRTAWVPSVTDTPWAREQLGGGDYAGAVMGGVDNGLRLAPGRVNDAHTPVVRAAGGGTVVVRKPTLFSVGRQPFLVGEHGHDELVGLTASPDGGAVVHVDPLQNPRVPVSASDAAAANALVPGSPYHPMLRRMEGGGTYAVGSDPGGVGVGELPPGWKVDPFTGDVVYDPELERIQRGDAPPIVHAGAARDVQPSNPGMPQATSLGVAPAGGTQGAPIPTSPFYPGEERGRQGSVVRLAEGGTYSVGPPIAAAGTQLVPAARRFGKPSLFLSGTGQVQVPGAKAGTWVTRPWYAANPWADPTQARSSTVDALTPLEQDAFGQQNQQQVGYGWSQWAAQQARARPWFQRPVQGVRYGR